MVVEEKIFDSSSKIVLHKEIEKGEDWDENEDEYENLRACVPSVFREPKT